MRCPSYQSDPCRCFGCLRRLVRALVTNVRPCALHRVLVLEHEPANWHNNANHHDQLPHATPTPGQQTAIHVVARGIHVLASICFIVAAETQTRGGMHSDSHRTNDVGEGRWQLHSEADRQHACSVKALVPETRPVSEEWSRRGVVCRRVPQKSQCARNKG